MQREKLSVRLHESDRPTAVALARTPYTLEHVETPEGRPYEFEWHGGSSYLAWHDIVLDDGELKGSDIGTIRRLDLRGQLTFAPQGMQLSGWAQPVARPNSFTTLYFDQDWLFDELESPDTQRALSPLIYFDDRSLVSTMEKLTHAVKSKTPRMLVDSLALLAGMELIAAQSSQPLLLQANTSELSKAQIERSKALIEERYMDDLSLAEMANASGLSVFHFARAFKRTTSFSPYRYLLATRVERAKDLMRVPEMSIASIGSAVGFKTASQFSRTFMHFTGLSPTAYRRQLTI